MAVIERYAALDRRVKLIRQKKLNVAAALNTAYQRSSGNILCLLDSDDVFLPTKVEAVVRAFRARPSSGMCLHWFELCSTHMRHLRDSSDFEISSGWRAPYILAGHAEHVGPASSPSWRREVAERVFPIPLTLYAYADAYLGMTALLTTEVTGVAAVLMKYRLHGRNLSSCRRFSPLKAAKMLDIVASVHREVQCYLRFRYGQGVADLWPIERNPHYWFWLLVLALYAGRRPSTVGGLNIRHAFGHLKPRQRNLLAVAWWIPHCIRVPLLNFWLGHSPARYAVERLVRKLCMQRTL